eukprot:SM000011S19180  [mRNA]  locus=s11:1234586:1237562:- [translate_table: standard]
MPQLRLAVSLATAALLIASVVLLPIQPQAGSSLSAILVGHPSDLLVGVWNITRASPDKEAPQQRQMTVNDTPASKLRSVLETAATPDSRIVIVTSFTAAWKPMLELFLEQLRSSPLTQALIRHLLVLSFDDKGYSYCQKLGLHCYLDTQESATKKGNYSGAAKVYMTPIYLDMMWRRLELKRDILQLGYNVLFTDTDILWFQDPLPLLQASQLDIQFACDRWRTDPAKPAINAGFYFARSNNRTIAFYDHWLEGRTKARTSKMLPRCCCQLMTITLPLKLDLTLLVTVHANCCVGMDRKLGPLKRMMEDKAWLDKLSCCRDELYKHHFRWLPPKCTP